MAQAPHHVLEPEFTGPPPRAIPESLRSGPYARRRRAALLGGFASGAACVLLAQLPWIERLAVYLLPLGYLDWLGAGLLALSAAGLAQHALTLGPYRYVRDGIPIPAEIGLILKAVASEYNGSPATHRFEVAAQVSHPETGEPESLVFCSQGFPSGDRDAYAAPFRRGDVVTAVYLPGDFERSVCLYPLLELNPAHSLRKADRPGPAAARAKLALGVLALISPFLGIFWGLAYWPLALEPGPALWAAAAGSLVAGAAFVGGIFWSHRRREREVAGRNVEALESGGAFELSVPVGGSGRLGVFLKWLLVAGAPLLGATLVVPYCLLANAKLDASPPRLEPIRIEARTERTYNLVFRQYRLEFAFENGPEGSQHLALSPEELAAFEGERGVAVVREGRLGWRWVESVAPAP
jgi:hypothetical protein